MALVKTHPPLKKLQYFCSPAVLAQAASVFRIQLLTLSALIASDAFQVWLFPGV